MQNKSAVFRKIGSFLQIVLEKIAMAQGSRIHRIAKALISFLKTGDRVLDIGAGNGAVGSILIRKKSISYTGIDILSFKPADPTLNLLKSDMPYPLKDNSFECVLMIFTLHHMDDINKGIDEAIRLSKKRIIIIEDVPRNIIERMLMCVIDVLGNKFVSLAIPTPCNFLYDQDWKRLFKDKKLRLICQSSVHPLWFPRMNHPIYVVEK